MSTKKLTAYPFDLESLQKGSWIPPERCEEVAGCKRVERDYSLKLLSLSSDLARSWFLERREVITTRIEKDGIRICIDDEAIDVNDRRFNSRVSGMRRDHTRLVGIDREKLPSDERRDQQERLVVKQGAFITAGLQAAQQVALQPHVRQTPTLSGKKDD